MGALTSFINRNGRFPQVTLNIRTLPRPGSTSKTVTLSNFLSYSFDSSVVVPVDSFTFTFAYPATSAPFSSVVKPGDIAQLVANGKPICTGLVDSTQIETGERGELVTVNGRNLLGQLEDQSSVSSQSSPIFAENVAIQVVLNQLLAGTRIGFGNFRINNLNSVGGNNMFATEPGESKLTSLMRYLESLNLLVWMDPNGTLVVGKPTMNPPAKGKIICSRSQKFSNVTSIRVVDSSGMIPNLIIPMYSGQEAATKFVAQQQGVENAAEGPNRLLKAGSIITKSIVTSMPTGSGAQALVGVNVLKALGANLLQGLAKRELCRENFKELQIQAVVPGHYDDNASPFLIDSTYRVIYDRGGIDQTMYLYAVHYGLSEGGGQVTTLSLCKTGTIVGDVGS